MSFSIIKVYLVSDTRTTQWEDPRLQSSAITGPVSIISVEGEFDKTDQYSVLEGF